MYYGVKSQSKLIYIYYLLYQLHNSNLLWIINISESYELLKNKISSLSKKEKSVGKYLIMQRYVSEDILYKKFKQFQLYDQRLYDYIIFIS